MASERRVERTIAGLAALALVAALGCSGMDFGPPTRVPVDQRQAVDASAVGSSVSLPKDRAFNVHFKQSNQNPGSDGTARGSADADGAGTAACATEASNGGSAAGEFQIGHAMDSRAEVPVRAAVKLTFKLAQELDASPRSGSGMATLALTAFVRDSEGRIFPKFAVEALTSDEAAGRGSRSETREFAFTMEPGKSYQILLAGQVNVTTEADTRAMAQLEIEDLEMAIDFASVPEEEAQPQPASAGR
ncbi:MAG: hypothetical protein JXA69_17460 [Phycisphaerae bacterium]|nr:hypothetical protein [Phycisphaerae bacterium]